MEKIKYEILRKNIPSVELVSLTGQTWYDSNHELFPWTGSTGNYIGPNVDDVVYNVTGSTPVGYYKWLGSIWTGITKTEAYDNHNLLIFLENTINDLGVMIGWDGEIEQVEQLCNFTYSGYTDVSGVTYVTISNSVNPDKLRTIINQEFEIYWGDGTFETLPSTEFAQLTHSYPYIINGFFYEISIYLYSTWATQKLTKTINTPFIDPTIIDNEFGTFTGYTLTGGTFEQDYLNNLDLYTGETSGTSFTYAAIGGSKLDQKKIYGSTGYTLDVIFTTGYTEYVIDDFTYRDYPDGYTIFTGSTVGIPKEEIPNICLTRNEHFLGFIDEPTVYSDIFVERGKQGVMEKNFRLSEIDNIGELEIYGNGYFNIKKQ
jgi:hypothetical protein